MSKIVSLIKNRWFKFSVVSIIYILWFVVWSRNLWMLLGLPIIFDIYITKLLNRFIGEPYKKRKEKSKGFRELMGWVEAIIFAAVVATVINTYIFQMYKIPTPSMEKSLLVGDYLCVSKIAYGPRMANTPLSFPLVHNTMPFSSSGKKSFSEAISRPYKRLAGRGSVERGDIVVFNFPAGDTVLLENQAVTYYDYLRDYQAMYGEKAGREKLAQHYTIISRPVDKREHYVKRAVALPGDSLEIRHSQLYINGRYAEPIDGRQYVYFVTINGTPISNQAFEKMGIAKDDILFDRENQRYQLPLTDKNLRTVQSMNNVVSVEKYESTQPMHYIFPNEGNFGWTEDNFGPLWIPKKGATVELTTENLPLYRRIIDVYEANDLEERDGKIYINGKEATSYTFKMDYYFMMGDNRHNSADSRFWGFVPEDHVVGRPSFVWLSIDKDKKFPKNIRWNHMFRSLKE
ncbi:MAG: signal peptidase I [Tidjanibacter sp.]|nr:signal peptidase I [Tidjanibacter sp.]